MKIIVSFYGTNPSLVQKQNIYNYLSILRKHLSFYLLNIIITSYSVEISVNKNKNIFSYSSNTSINLILYKFIKSTLRNIYTPHLLSNLKKVKICNNIVKVESGFIHKKIKKMNSYGQSISIFKNILSSFVTIILKKKICI